MLSQYVSDKLRVMSFFAIILVLYIHAVFHDYPNEIQGMPYNFLMQEFVSGMIGRCAVPLFFAVSGYLFFVNVDLDAGDTTVIYAKMKKRVFTLLVPYLIAAWFPALFYLALEYIPGVGGFINGEAFSENFDRRFLDFLCFMYWDTGGGAPYAFHLWFLRDLIVIVAFAPVIYHVLRYRMGGMLLLALLFVLIIMDVPYLPVYGMFWFVWGHCCLGVLSRVAGRLCLPCSAVFVVLCLAELFCQSSVWEYLKVPVIMLGIMSMWTLYDKIVPETFRLSDHKYLLVACTYTFFVYLFHEPTLNVVRKILVIPFHHSSLGFALSYLLSPWIFAVLMTIAGVSVKRWMPRLYSICVGGR